MVYHLFEGEGDTSSLNRPLLSCSSPTTRKTGKLASLSSYSLVPFHVEIIVPVNISCYISMEKEI